MSRFVVVLAAWLALWWSVVGALLAPVLPGGWGAVAALVLLTTLPLPIIVRGRRAGRVATAAERVWLLRPFVYAQLLLPLAAVAGLLGAAFGAAFGAAGAAGMTGRGAMAVAAGVFAVLALCGYAGSRRLVRTDIVARWDDLPPGLDGMRIAQISDTHVGPQTSRRHLAHVARIAAESRADLVVVTGDLVDDHAPDVAHYAAGLGALAAPLGVYAVAGNHDVYAGWPAVHERLRALPLTVLVNEWRWLERNGARFALLGTGDPAGGRGGTEAGGPDLDRALQGLPRDAFVIALAHNPALWPALAKRGVRLTLSGHTHWGQLAIPGLGWSLASPFNAHAMGGYVEGEAVLYVHPGSNYWGIPFRLGTPPEVAVIELRRA
jgi:predicted MPP superfamily phosphohydrolase